MRDLCRAAEGIAAPRVASLCRSHFGQSQPSPDDVAPAARCECADPVPVLTAGLALGRDRRGRPGRCRAAGREDARSSSRWSAAMAHSAAIPLRCHACALGDHGRLRRHAPLSPRADFMVGLRGFWDTAVEAATKLRWFVGLLLWKSALLGRAPSRRSAAWSANEGSLGSIRRAVIPTSVHLPTLTPGGGDAQSSAAAAEEG
jgi:hypothetical protein